MSTVIDTTFTETVVITIYELLQGIVLGLRDNGIKAFPLLHASAHIAAAKIDGIITTDHPEGLTLNTHVTPWWIWGTSALWSDAVRRGHKTKLLKGPDDEYLLDYFSHTTWERLARAQVTQPGSRQLWQELARIFADEFDSQQDKMNPTPRA